MQQGRLNWPNKVQRRTLDQQIISSAYEPFALASYKVGHEITDFVGRSEELLYFKSIINSVVQFGKSKAVRLEGPAGVGKSTLFNFIKQSINQERNQPGGISKFIGINTDIFSAYFEIQDQILEYRNIWRPLLETLYGNFTAETGEDIGLPEYVALNFILALLKDNPAEVSLIIWRGNPIRFQPDSITVREILPPIMDHASEVIPKLQDYYAHHTRSIRSKFKVKLHGQRYAIKRLDNSTIKNLFRVLDEGDKYLEQIMDADQTIFSTDDELISYFNDLIRFYICATGKQPVLLVGIDEIAKADAIGREAFYVNLGNMFVSLRNKLDFTLFVFISTTEDWAQYDKVISTYSDLNNQISGFMDTLQLKSLSLDDVTLLFQKRLINFWNRYPQIRHSATPFYPFSQNTFKYAYQYKNRDLRFTIHLLRDMWRSFKISQVIPRFLTRFEVMRNIRQFDKVPWELQSFRKFDWEIINQEFNKPGRFKTNQNRSSAVEVAFELAWKVLMNTKITSITGVANNPTILIENRRLRPDVVVKLNETMGKDLRRVIEFQVKMYEKDHFVANKHIQSSITLFREGYTSFLYFLISGKGLSPTARKNIEKVRKKYPNRIRLSVLNERQQKYLYFLVLFEEIIGQPIDNSFSTLIYDILSKILNQRPERLIQEVMDLPPHKESLPRIESPLETIVPEPKQYPADQTQLTDLKSFQTLEVPKQAVGLYTEKSLPGSQSSDLPSISKSATKSDNKEEHQPQEHFNPPTQTISVPSWLENHPQYEPYKEELCGICQYMQKREKGRWKGKFTNNVIYKHVVIGNPSLSKEAYRNLIKLMYNDEFLLKENTSHKFTDKGWQLYFAIKNSEYTC